MTYEIGDLRVWHIPQIPMHAFYVDVPDIKTALIVLNALADYDLFQYENNVKPDYCNASGVQRYEDDGEFGNDWFDIDEDEYELSNDA